MPDFKTHIIIALFSLPALAAQFSINFDTASQFDTSGTAVLNLFTHKLHVPFIVDRTDTTVDTIETEDDSFPIGTGGHGIFNSSTYASFDVNQGATPNLVTLNSDTVYEFTEFTLASGYTLKGQGSAPLRIRIQGDARVAGRIDLRGTAGASASSDASTPPSGGTSSCGGASGGSGGTSSQPASDGTSADSGDTGKGKKALPSTTAGQRSGGGGGGGFERTPYASVAGANGGGTGGAGGAGYSDEFLSTLVGGSGGGGGASYTLGGSNGSGGGGGAGGGALQLFIGGNLTIDTGGEILATGGNGGSHLGGVLSGGGGGGAGGAIVLFMGGTFVDNGTINADGGRGGGTVNPATDGNGAQGRTRFVNANNTWTGTGSESPTPNMPNSVGNSFGQTFYTKNSVYIFSKSFDTQNSSPTYDSVDVDETKPTGSSIAYTFSGSNDNFQTDATEYVSLANIGQLSGKRYIKFKITMNAGARTATPTVNRLTIHYTEHVQDAFTFGSSTGCAAVHRPQEKSTKLAALFFILYLLLLPTLSKLKRLQIPR